MTALLIFTLKTSFKYFFASLRKILFRRLWIYVIMIQSSILQCSILYYVMFKRNWIFLKPCAVLSWILTTNGCNNIRGMAWTARPASLNNCTTSLTLFQTTRRISKTMTYMRRKYWYVSTYVLEWSFIGRYIFVIHFAVTAAYLLPTIECILKSD